MGQAERVKAQQRVNQQKAAAKQRATLTPEEMHAALEAAAALAAANQDKAQQRVLEFKKFEQKQTDAAAKEQVGLALSCPSLSPNLRLGLGLGLS